jgi:hypothetical protein
MFITSPEAFAEWFNEKIPDVCRKIESQFPPDKPCRRAVPAVRDRIGHYKPVTVTDGRVKVPLKQIEVATSRVKVTPING